MGPTAREIWDDMPLAKKNSIIKKAKADELMGECLLIKMYAVVRQEVKTKCDIARAALASSTTFRDLNGSEKSIIVNRTICDVKIYANLESIQTCLNAEAVSYTHLTLPTILLV